MTFENELKFDASNIQTLQVVKVTYFNSNLNVSTVTWMFSLTYAELSRADAPRNALVLTMLYNQAINYHNKVLGIFGPPSPVTTNQVH